MGAECKTVLKKCMTLAIVFVLAYLVGGLVGYIGGKDGQTDTPVIRLADLQQEDTQEMEQDNRQEEEVQEIREVALTFDDGPNPDYTEKLLEGLKKRGVKATFFVLGSQVEQYPEILSEIWQDGHQIGVHSYQHVNFGQIGDEAAIEQIEKTQEAIHEVTGEYAGFIRPPYGCWKDSLNEKVPMIEVLWDIDPLDWATTDANTVAQRILTAVDEGGSIILLHDASKSSVQAAFTVVDALLEQGYQFVTVEELLLE